MPSADRKDYGFVTFDTHDAAVTCAKSINNTELGEGNNKVCQGSLWPVVFYDLSITFFIDNLFFQAKVRARLSRPRHRGRTKPTGRDNFRSARGSGRVVRGSWGHPAPHGYPTRGVRGVGNHVPPPIAKRPVGLRDSRMRDRRPAISVPARGRALALPPRSYDRRAPGNLHFVCI